MVLRNLCLASLSLLLLSNCTVPEPEIITNIEYIEKSIPIQARPKAVNMAGVEWYVITADNLDEVIEKIESDNGQLAVMATSVRGYENLALNVSELKRYILQQQEIIVYYEKQAASKDTEEKLLK